MNPQTRKFAFKKLVRDKIKTGIESSGGLVHGHKILKGEEYISALLNKLSEEAMETTNASPAEQKKELADLQEIVDCLMAALGVSREELSELQAQKVQKAGSFKNGDYIDHVEVPSNSKWIEYYLSEPDKYPEISE